MDGHRMCHRTQVSAGIGVAQHSLLKKSEMRKGGGQVPTSRSQGVPPLFDKLGRPTRRGRACWKSGGNPDVPECRRMRHPGPASDRNNAECRGGRRVGVGESFIGQGAGSVSSQDNDRQGERESWWAVGECRKRWDSGRVGREGGTGDDRSVQKSRSPSSTDEWMRKYWSRRVI